jgi:hypothetical protein
MLSARLTVERLEHTARWVKLVELINKPVAWLDAVQMVIYPEPYDQPDDSSKELRLTCTYRKIARAEPSKVQLVTTASVPYTAPCWPWATPMMSIPATAGR